MESNSQEYVEGMVSIIIPIFRVEKYINTCVQSVVMQSYENIEIILVDDGSDDHCPHICDQWMEKDKRIKVVHKKNGGLAEARNYGLDLANGEYIVFVDGDDYIHKDMIKFMVDTSNKYSANMVCCNFQKVCDDKISKKMPIIKEYAVKQYDCVQALENLNDIMVISCAKIYKKDPINNLRFPVGRLHEDEFMIHKFIYYCGKIVKLDAPLYYYFQREDSIVHSIKKKNIEDAMDAYEERLKFLDEHKLEETKSQIFKGIFEYVVATYNQVDCNDDKELKNYIQNRYKKIIQKNRNICIPKEGRILERGCLFFDIYRKIGSVRKRLKQEERKNKEL